MRGRGLRGVGVVSERGVRGGAEGQVRGFRGGKRRVIDDDLREQRKARKYGERRGSRVVERSCQVAVCRCWGREGLGFCGFGEELKTMD